MPRDSLSPSGGYLHIYIYIQIKPPEGDRESRGKVVWGIGQESGIGHSGLVPWEPTEREFRLTGRAGKGGKREEKRREEKRREEKKQHGCTAAHKFRK